MVSLNRERRRPSLRRGLPAAGLALFLCLFSAESVQPRADGRLAAGLDPSFGGDGFVVNPALDRVEVGEDASGRLLIAGGGEGELLAARYRPDGRLDRRFGRNGLARVKLPGFASGPAGGAGVRAVAVQANGKILIGGSFQPAPRTGLGPSAVLVRLGSNGRLDTGFGTSRIHDDQPGMVILSARQTISAIALDGGKILVGGTAGRGFVGRFNRDGSLDRSFGGGRLGGWFNLPPRPQGKTRVRVDAGVEELVPGPGRTIYAGGYANGGFMLAHLRRDGRLDRGFGEGGIVRIDAARRRACACSIGEGLAADERGRLLISGSLLSRSRGHRRAIAVARFWPDGTLDRSFGTRGIARTRLGVETRGGPLVIQPGGRIVLAGSTGDRDGRYRLALLGYTRSGRLDPGFSGNGIFAASLGASSSEPSDLLVGDDGRVVVAGAGRFRSRSADGQSALLARIRP